MSAGQHSKEEFNRHARREAVKPPWPLAQNKNNKLLKNKNKN